MRPVTLSSVALAGLLCLAAPADAAPPGEAGLAQTTTPVAPSPPNSAAAPRTPAPPAPAASPRAPAPGARALERRRRTSYAACNRESHRRRLSGGARRRFLVRCRLGYERRPASAPSPARRP